LVVIVIFVPETVTIFLDKPVAVDMNAIQLIAPPEDASNVDNPNDQSMMEDLMKDYQKGQKNSK
jgi:hypothetical protein